MTLGECTALVDGLVDEELFVRKIKKLAFGIVNWKEAIKPPGTIVVDQIINVELLVDIHTSGMLQTEYLKYVEYIITIILSRCYVGPERTQWRKCSDRYFPYVHNIIDRLDHIPTKPYLPLPTKPWAPIGPPYRPGARPDRPPAPPIKPPPRPSLDEYEAQFDEEFLEPPKPGKIIPEKRKLTLAVFVIL